MAEVGEVFHFSNLYDLFVEGRSRRGEGRGGERGRGRGEEERRERKGRGGEKGGKGVT